MICLTAEIEVENTFFARHITKTILHAGFQEIEAHFRVAF